MVKYTTARIAIKFFKMQAMTRTFKFGRITPNRFENGWRFLTSQAFSPIRHEDLQPIKPAKLRGRRFLPDSDKNSFPLFLQAPRENFPLALKAEANQTLEDWGKLCRKEIDANLIRYGAILFRQLPIATVEDFRKLVQSVGFPLADYDAGSGHRDSVAEKIYSASDEPPEYSIELHNEMSYSPVYNKKIFFSCIKAAEIGGESAVCKNNELFSQLDDKFVKKIREKRIRYIRQCKDKSLCEYISWQKVFATDCKKTAEEKMKDLGFDWEWSNENNILKFWNTLDAFANHYITNEEIWFNQIHSMHDSYFKAHPTFHNKEPSDCFYPNHTTYGDGEEIEPEFLEQVRAAGWKCAVGLSLSKGDFLVLDNMLAQHSRLGFKGDRKIMVALTD